MEATSVDRGGHRGVVEGVASPCWGGFTSLLVLFLGRSGGFLPYVVVWGSSPTTGRFNFIRIHKTLRVTPAMESGIVDHLFSFEDLMGIVDEWERNQTSAA